MQRANLKPTKDKIQKEKVIQDWLDGLRPATIDNYLKALALFTQLTGKSPTELLEITWKEQEERTPPWQQSIEKWYTLLKEYDQKTNASKTTSNVRKANISAFFHFYRIMTPKTYLKRKKDNLIIKNEREGLTKQDIKDALHGANSFKIKALILTQATSGIAIQDVLQLNIEQFYDGLIDLKEGYQICKIHHKRTKSSREHYTFISFEAVALIKKYIKLERLGHSKGPLFTSRDNVDTRYSYRTYAIMIYRLNKKLGWYKGNYRYGKLTTHMFRKFFETQLTNAGIINDHLVHLMGWKHKDPLKATYYLANPDELQKSYIKHLDYLTLENVETITLNSPEVKQLQDQIDSQQKLIDQILRESKIEEEYDKLRKK
ncbi:MULTISPECIES: tyrosine-type recombinase/integrase [Methanobacterium]|uniref:Tyr recombinase domain-containing protein n=1 Tax=Methanobacterium bryantii TaxID=2161 RepID=A0A2A2H8X7_METBR|nr:MULTISPECIES: site-specific integrase [Methanobacterium]OEC87846.1 hypothetical protein A9507_06640 [Methanobacterium sp. A39]PAV05713.1 hypothetical protein ASJ80_08250 [Methanobacterium bryantii]